ncbi:hypothetical protein AVEN_235498-1 [Araneus ventricosus]|uniref:Uncharacterized protein n=1 Tax=Araneus ventricosus TaxID=182803 RepID=A0A4Y2A4X4_ARAVE|nr:hypothetical protein AVEN_235498-1 [Araneus ventricosus]
MDRTAQTAIHFLQAFRTLRSPRATTPIPPPAFKTGLPQWFCGFRFSERVSLPLPHGRISDFRVYSGTPGWVGRRHFFRPTGDTRIDPLMAEHSKWIVREVRFPRLSTVPLQFSLDFRIDDLFGALRTNLRGVE